jgi:hypothetical protein
MDTTLATVMALCVLALAAIAFFAVFRRRGKATFKSVLGEAKFEGDNDGPPDRIASGVNASGAKAGRNLRAHSTAAGGVSAIGAEAGGDLDLSHRSQDDASKKA